MFFYAEQVNAEISEIIEKIFSNANGEDEPENNLADGEESIQPGAIITELKKYTEDKFKNKWGWIDLAINVAKETNTSFFEVMDKPVLVVITLASYLTDKVELIESRMAK